MDLYKGKYWNVVFGAMSQEFPGYCFIGNDKESLSDIEPEGWEELGRIVKELERVCKKVFGATMFNFSCLMNNAYRDDIKPMVHFHFMPRYKDKVELFGKTYEDIHFGYNFWKWANDEKNCQKDIFTEEEKEKMFEMMKNEFKM